MSVALVYVLRCDDCAALKVGRSRTPASRLASIQGSLPREARIAALALDADETKIHRGLSPHRLLSEWYDDVALEAALRLLDRSPVYGAETTRVLFRASTWDDCAPIYAVCEPAARRRLGDVVDAGRRWAEARPDDARRISALLAEIS